MKKLIFIILIIAPACKQKQASAVYTPSNKTYTIDLEDNLEWEEIENFITHFNNENTDLATGKIEIIDFLKKNYPSFDSEFIEQIDIVEFKKEFLEWVKVPLQMEKPSNNLKAFYFGIFSSSLEELTDGLDEIKVMYIAGSATSPIDSPQDWAVDPEYFPDARYFVPDEFHLIESELNKYENTMDVEQIIYNSLTNLVIINSRSELREMIDIESFYLGSGFDEGPPFQLGKIQ